MHSNKDFVVLPLKTKNCIFPKADSKKTKKKKEKEKKKEMQLIRSLQVYRWC